MDKVHNLFSVAYASNGVACVGVTHLRHPMMGIASLFLGHRARRSAHLDPLRQVPCRRRDQSRGESPGRRRRMKSRPAAALLAALFAVAASVAPAAAESWPSHPVRIINTFAAGGAADILARIAADKLTKALGQQFYVETHAGAGG